LVHFQREGTLLVAFKMHGLKHQKMAFLYVSQIIVRVQAIEDPHNQIIVRVRTCGPSRDRRLCRFVLLYILVTLSYFEPTNCIDDGDGDDDDND